MSYFYKNFLFFALLCCSFKTAFALQETIKEGLIYEKIVTEDQQIIHVLNIDPKKFDIKIAHAKGHVLGLDTVASIAKEHSAIVGINGGFFHMGEGKDGLSAGILKIDNKWYSLAPRLRAALGWSKNLEHVLMDRVRTKSQLQVGNYRFPIDVINQPCLSCQAVLYNDVYGENANSPNNGTDVVIDNNEIVSITPSNNSSIPENGYVYSIGPHANITRSLFKIGHEARLKVEVVPSFQKDKQALWQKVDYIVGGIPLLLENGRNLQNSNKNTSEFIMNQHARTAIGLLDNGHWIMVVVEKNQLDSVGMSIPELSQFMKKMGCYDAINLDGGSSSSFYIKDNEMNISSFARPVANAILVLPKT